MRRTWLAVLVLTLAVLVAPDPVASAAPAACSPSDPAPEVVSAEASSVVIGGSTRREHDPQDALVRVRDACGGMFDFQGCSFDPPQPCFTGELTMRRTAAATSSAARRCARFLSTFDDGSAHRLSADDPAVVEAGFRHGWDAYDDMEEHQGPFSNACAGAWDLTARFAHTTSDGGTAMGAPFTVTRAFQVRRRAALTSDAGPEPVRAGGTVTVRGRLVRADWDDGRTRGYGGVRVALQRRTATGPYRTVRWVTAGADGRLRTSLRALSTARCYRWAFGGSSTTGPATGNGDCVAVRR